MPYILTTLVYAVRGDEVLMMHRRKEPNLGLWIAPGGKINADESPRECAVRELREETNLTAVRLDLRVIATEISPRPDWQWLMFIYRAEVEPGETRGEDREGRLQWFHRDEVPALPIPQADAIFYPIVMEDGPVEEMVFRYDAELKLVGWESGRAGDRETGK